MQFAIEHGDADGMPVLRVAGELADDVTMPALSLPTDSQPPERADRVERFGGTVLTPAHTN